jgi:hypothetical protein
LLGRRFSAYPIIVKMSLDRAPRAVNGDERGSKFNRVAEVYIELQAFRCAWRGSQRVIRTLREPRDVKPWQVHERTQNPGAGMTCPGRVKCHSGIKPWRRSRSATPRTIEMLCSGCEEVHFGGEVYGTRAHVAADREGVQRHRRLLRGICRRKHRSKSPADLVPAD